MKAAEVKEFRLVLSEFTKKQDSGFIRATGSIFFLSFSSTQSENRPFITMTCRFWIFFRWNRTIVSAAAFAFAADLQAVLVDLAGYNPDCGLAVKADGDSLTARWKTPEGATVLTLDVSGKGALVQSIAVASGDAEPVVVLRDANPVTVLTVGERDLKKRGGWTIFLTGSTAGQASRGNSI